MASYDELKQELVEISKIVEKFPEGVKPKVYDLLVGQFLGTSVNSNAHTQETPKKSTRAFKKKTTKVINDGSTPETTQKRQSGKESYSIDRQLDLRGDGSIPSFKEFHDEKKPKLAKQFNAVAVYYLKKLKGITQVSLNHVYTCYSEVKVKPPTAFRQSFIDTKNKEGWIEFDKAGYLEIPHRGSVFVEHDLPQAKAGKA